MKSAWHPAWPGFSARGSVLLPLPGEYFARLAPAIPLDGIELARKREFHVTLLDRALGARLQSARPRAAEELAPLFTALDWALQCSGERWLLRETKVGASAQAIVELLEMPALARFRHGAGVLLGEPLPPVPAHVTLYVAGSESGIGLRSLAEFERLRVRKMGSESTFRDRS